MRKIDNILFTGSQLRVSYDNNDYYEGVINFVDGKLSIDLPDNVISDLENLPVDEKLSDSFRWLSSVPTDVQDSVTSDNIIPVGEIVIGDNDNDVKVKSSGINISQISDSVASSANIPINEIVIGDGGKTIASSGINISQITNVVSSSTTMSPNDIIVGDGNKNIVSSGVNLLDVLCEGNDYYVTSSGDDSNDGLSWSSPKKTIQGAYDAAVNGDIINVASGTYQFDEEFIVEKGIKIIGVDGPDVTTIERPDAAVDEYRVITLAHYGATLFGFTIRNGYAPSDPLTGNGGNVLITHDAHIENCIIQEGNAWQYGGGVMFGSPGGSMARCIIRNNEVRGASGTGGGGGIYIRTTSTIQSCLIYDNIAPSGGGIGCATNSYGTVIEHCTITKNKAVGWNAGVMVYGGGFVGQQSGHLVACIVWGNFRGDGTTPDDASFVQYGASVVAKSLNNDFGTKTAVFGAVPTDPSNISADPLFVDSGNDDFHLQPSSPCIGIETIHDPLETPFNTIDLDKNIWYSTPYASIGCYSYLGYEGIPINNSSLSSDNLKDAVNELVTLSATMTIISGVPAGPYTVGQYHFDTDLPAMVIYTGNSASGWETAAGVDPY